MKYHGGIKIKNCINIYNEEQSQKGRNCPKYPTDEVPFMGNCDKHVTSY